MIVETVLEDGLIERRSDKGVYIRNVETGEEYAVAIDWNDLNRIRRGKRPCRYVETARAIEQDGDKI